MKLTITGLDEYERALLGVRAEIEREMADAGKTAIGRLMASFRQETPVRTGFLRDSEHLFQPTEAAVTFQASAEYASFVNDGTRFQRANPFVERAVDRARPDVERVYREQFDEFADDFGE